MNFFVCEGNTNQLLQQEKPKNINNIRVEKVPTWLWCQCDFPKVIKHPSLSICYFLFWSYLFYAFYSFSLAVVAIFRFCHRPTYCWWQNRFFFTAKLKVYLWLFSIFPFFSIFFTEGKIQLCFTRLDRQYTFSSHRTG